MNLTGKTIVITGGGSGIGRATAVLAAQCGAAVIVLGRRQDRLEQTKQLISAAGGKCEIFVCDLTSDSDIDSFFDRYENAPLGALVNNGGILGRYPEDFATAEASDIDLILRTNLRGAMRMSQRFIANVINHDTKNSSIVHIGSICAYGKNSNNISYAAAKSGLTGLSAGLASRYGCYGVRSNVVCAGFIVTDMTYEENPSFDDAREELAAAHPLRRLGAPDDVANAVVFLLSDRAAFITGTSLLVDGGLGVAD